MGHQSWKRLSCKYQHAFGSFARLGSICAHSCTSAFQIVSDYVALGLTHKEAAFSSCALLIIAHCLSAKMLHTKVLAACLWWLFRWKLKDPITHLLKEQGLTWMWILTLISRKTCNLQGSVSVISESTTAAKFDGCTIAFLLDLACSFLKCFGSIIVNDNKDQSN